MFIGSHAVLPDTPAPCPDRIERKSGECRHQRAPRRGKYPRRQQSDGMHHQRKRRIYHRQPAWRTAHAALLLHRLHPRKIHYGRTRDRHPRKAGRELQQPQPGGSDRNRYAPPHDGQPRSRLRNHGQRNRRRQRIHAGRSAGETDAQHIFLHQRHGHYHEPERHQRGLHTDTGKRQASGRRRPLHAHQRGQHQAHRDTERRSIRPVRKRCHRRRYQHHHGRCPEHRKRIQLHPLLRRRTPDGKRQCRCQCGQVLLLHFLPAPSGRKLAEQQHRRERLRNRTSYFRRFLLQHRKPAFRVQCHR